MHWKLIWPIMVLPVCLLFLLGQLPRIFSSVLLVDSKLCGSLCIVYSSTHGIESYYIDGYMVEKDLFCNDLKFHLSSPCVIETTTPTRRVLEPSLLNFPTRAVRKLLQMEVEERYNENKNDKDTHFTSTKVAVATCGLLMFCCSFICSCFRARKKENLHTVLSKDPGSIDSLSSIELHSTENFLGSPLRVPPSPLRVPASPRFSMSPKLCGLGSVHLSLSQISKATHNFSDSQQIGEGGFGTVYKAQLQDGQVVAIKRAKKEHFENLRTEFSSEVELLSKIDHRNLVRLLSYVDKGNECLIITEYVSNGTLREHLDGQRGRSLDFNQRLEISIDIAHGLTYLHLYAEKQIIHRDVKSSNILLTENYRAKVADFGFARFGPVDTEQTHILTKVKGTVGYLDPEYMRTYQLTPKSDVYSFGVLLLEILTGRRPVELKRSPDERVTLRWAFNKYNAGNVKEMVDPSMEEEVNDDILIKIFGLAIQCAAPTRSDRPDMKTVGEELWRVRMDYVKSLRR